MPDAEVIAELRKANEWLRSENLRLNQEVKLLQEKLDLLIRRFFGKSSEKMDPAQMLMALEELERCEEADLSKAADEAWRQDASGEPPRKRRRPGVGERIPESLPVVETILDPTEVKADPESWRLIGEETSDSLDYTPGGFQILRTNRRKFVKRNNPDSAPIIAPLPSSLQERCKASPGLIAQVVVSKYCDHLPLHRQEDIYHTRHGVWLPRQTLARWVLLCSDWLAPIYREIRSQLFVKGCVQVDETPVKYLSPGNGSTKIGYLWTICDPKGDVVYHWSTSRGAENLHNIIPVDFYGTMQTDGYSAYTSFLKKIEADEQATRITLAGCWAHARRHFFEAKKNSPQQAGWILRQIALLYQIESKLRRNRAGPKLRQTVRSAESRPIYERIGKAIIRWKATGLYLPRSAFGKAMNYALGQWEGLGRFLENGQQEIDNNLVENGLFFTFAGIPAGV